MSKRARHVTLKLARSRLVRQREVVTVPEDSPKRTADQREENDGFFKVELSSADSKVETVDEAATDAAVDATAIDKTVVLWDSPQSRVEVSVRLITLVCCSQKTVWAFRSRGLTQYGQTELLLVLERLPSDTGVPADIIRLFSGVLSRAMDGELVHDLDHTVFHSSSSILGSCYIGGVLYFMDSGQCFHGLVSSAEQCSLLICRLVHSREVNLLTRAPLRLLLRLGELDGVYPCSLISKRFRPPVEHDSCQSVYFLFREVLPQRGGAIARLRECRISLESGGSVGVTVSLARRRQADLLALLRIFAPDPDGVLALGGEFCQFADAHLVAMETSQLSNGESSSENVNHHSGCNRGCETLVFKAESVGKPSVTGASFIAVAARTPRGGSGGIGISGSVAAVVEDGIAVTCRREEMCALLQNLKCAADHTLTVDWLFPVQRRRVHSRCPIRFVWRLQPGDTGGKSKANDCY